MIPTRALHSITRRHGAAALRATILLAAASCVFAPSGPRPAIAPRTAAVFPADWRFRAGEPAVFATHAMVVSNSDIASRVGSDIMRRGGNAVDAAVAVGFAMTVTYPGAGNIGGGGFMVIRLASGESVALDYRETAPSAASRNMYLDGAGKLTNKSIVGHLAVGVPGSVAGMVAALEKYGTMSLRDVIAPAIELAQQGWVIDSSFSRGLGSDSGLVARFEGRRLFFPGGAVIPPGTRLVQPELAWTLRQISERGPGGFYEGPVADSLIAEMRRGGGIITAADLRAYKPIWRTPVRGAYRGYTILSMPPASSGGITMTEALNILETYDRPAPFGSTQWAHRLAESYQRAFIDRNAKIGDPAFVQVPQGALTSKEYARQLRATIDDRRHTPTPQLSVAGRDGMNTTHYSVVDGLGNAVAVTTTLNGTYGSGVWVRGAGFFLNNEMDDFAAQPGSPNMFGLVQGEQNAIAPGKRMLSAMTPTVVLDSAGQILLVVGGAGGPTIITGVSQVVLNVIDYRMSLADAMRAPRLHHQSLPDSLVWERGGLEPAVADSLSAMGHGLKRTRSLVNVNAIMRVRGGWEGVHEPRSHGGSVGY
jgi:gamma-glutamyltranspeptidase / glutathione hydrolase